jgi:hypothetical protein
MKKFTTLWAALALLAAVNLPAAMYNAPLTADAYTDSVLVDSNFDTGSLQSRGFEGETMPGSGVDSEQRTFLKFNVGFLADKTILSAKFGIYLNAFSDYSHPSLQLKRVGDGWTETGITWNNSQALVSGAVAIGTDEQFSELRYYEWDVFPTWDYGDLADGFVSYMLPVADESLNNYAYFNSGENAAFHPYLHIEYIPEPATLILMTLGGLAALRRRR